MGRTQRPPPGFPRARKGRETASDWLGRLWAWGCPQLSGTRPQGDIDLGNVNLGCGHCIRRRVRRRGAGGPFSGGTVLPIPDHKDPQAPRKVHTFMP